MRKGVILEIKKNYLVMFTPNGEFLKGSKLHEEYNVGQEISFDPYRRKSSFPLVKFPVKMSGIAAAALFIIFVVLFNLFNQNKAFAYVSIDANPSVELVLNKDLQVIKANALNDDGKKVLNKVQVNGKQDFEDIAKKILLQSESFGFLDENHKIVIASVITNDKKEKNKEKLSEMVQNLVPVAKSFHANLQVVNASMNERKNALKKGVSTGKYIMEKNGKKVDKKEINEEDKKEEDKKEVNEEGINNQRNQIALKNQIGSNQPDQKFDKHYNPKEKSKAKIQKQEQEKRIYNQKKFKVPQNKLLEEKKFVNDKRNERKNIDERNNQRQNKWLKDKVLKREFQNEVPKFHPFNHKMDYQKRIHDIKGK